MTEQTNAVAETNGNAVSTDVASGIAGQFTRDDVQQGRLSIMQSSSTLVKEEEARMGSIIDLASGEEVAYKGNKDEAPKDLEFMICGILKYWVVKNDDTDEFIEKLPANNMNDYLWEENVNGVNLKRTFHFSYMVLLADEIKDGIEMPYELAFRSTGTKDTKKLNSLIAKMAQKGISSHQKVFNGKIATRTKDSNSWYGLDLGILRDATEEEAKCVEGYFNEFVKMKEHVMNSGDTYGESEAAPASTVAQQANTDDY
jgi:hypothetical protein